MPSRMLLGGVTAVALALSSTPLTAAEFRLSAPCSLAPAAGSRAVAPSQPTECLFAADHLRAALFPADAEKPHARVIVFEWDSAKSRPRPTKALKLSVPSAGDPPPTFARMDAETWGWVRSEIGPDAPAQPPSTPTKPERPAEPPSQAQAQTIAVRYQYDFLGRLIYKIGNEGVRQYLYDGDSRRVLTELNEYGTVVASYSWSGDQLNSITRPGLGTFYPVTDGLGSIIALTDETGDVVARFQYDAWGNIRSSSETVPGITSYRFTGHRWQEEIGLYNANARYYSPEVGRFITQDTNPGKIDDPVTLNLYAYANANPTRYVDLDGHQSSDSKAFHREILAARAKAACEADPAGCAARRAAQEQRQIIEGSQGGHALGAGLRGGGAVALALTPEPTLLTKLAAGYLALTAGDDLGTLGRELVTQQPEKTGRTIVVEEGLRAINPNDVERRAAMMEALVDLLLPVAGGPKGTFNPSAFESGRLPTLVARPGAPIVAAPGAAEAVRVFRVEGAANQRLVIGPTGEVAITGEDSTLFLNFGSRARADEFLARRLGQGMSDATIKSFDVPKGFVNELRDAAVPERLGRRFPDRPILVDVTKAPDQFGLRTEQMEALKKAIQQGSGKVE